MPGCGHLDADTTREQRDRADSSQISNRPAQAECNEMQDPTTRTMEIPTYPASTSHARCKDAAMRNCVRVCVPAVAVGKLDPLRAIGPRCSDKIVYSKAFLPAPGVGSRNALRSS